MPTHAQSTQSAGTTPHLHVISIRDNRPLSGRLASCAHGLVAIEGFLAMVGDSFVALETTPGGPIETRGAVIAYIQAEIDAVFGVVEQASRETATLEQENADLTRNRDAQQRTIDEMLQYIPNPIGIL